MKVETFKEYLAIYGADISKWPEIFRHAAEKELQKNESFRQLLDSEKKFESVLSTRRQLSMLNGDDFANRIIASAALRAKAKPASIFDRIKLFFAEVQSVLPIARPAYTFALIAIFGVLLGFFAQPEPSTKLSPSGILYETRGLI